MKQVGPYVRANGARSRIAYLGRGVALVAALALLGACTTVHQDVVINGNSNMVQQNSSPATSANGNMATIPVSGLPGVP